jgi:carbon monoxide dehydrogenase subunit G
MSPESARNRDEFYDLVRRYNQLGRLLPSVDDFDASGPEARAEVDIVIKEMHKTKAAMDQLLIDERKRREAAGEPWR